MKYLGKITGAGVIHDKKGTYLAIEVEGETHLLRADSKAELDRLTMSVEDYIPDVVEGIAAEEHP